MVLEMDDCKKLSFPFLRNELTKTNRVNPNEYKKLLIVAFLFFIIGIKHALIAQSGLMPFTINQFFPPSPPIITPGGSTTLCPNEYVSLTSSASDSYVWSNGSTTQTTEVNLAGTYTLTITQNGCSASQTITIGQSTPIVITITSTSTECGKNLGSATASVAGGTPPYIYQWSSGSHEALADSLASNEYILQVYDANRCNASASANITPSDGPVAILENLQNTTCSDRQDGSLYVSVSGGAEPYTYSWSNGETSEDITNLEPNYYYLTITDANNCTSYFSRYIERSTAPTFNFNLVRPDCGELNGSIVASVSGGAEPYSDIRWLEGSAVISMDELELTNLKAGPYTFELLDGNGCPYSNLINLRSDTNDFTIMVNNVTPSNCHSSPNGAADISVEGGTPPYNYSWSNGISSEDLNNVNAGTYFLSVTDANRCVAIEGVVVPSVLQSLQYRQQLCIVTVDTATSKNLIIWEKNQQEGIKDFRIYRETINNRYQLLSSLSFNDLSEFTDPLANTNNHSWRYKITAVDSCGEESTYSNPHKTIHLVQKDLSGGGYNLSWDYYDGSNYSIFDIWREIPGSGWENIKQLAGNITSYVDTSQTAKSTPDARYMIEVTLTNSCESTAKGIGGPKGTATTVVKSKSNIRNNRNIAPLPVSLLSFNAQCKNNQVQLTWATQSENNNDYFDVERSSDAIYYSKVARVNGKGSTNQTQFYKLYDEEPLSGISYYRLRQVDYNGSTKLLTPAVSNCELKTDISILPNPSKGVFEIKGLGIHQEVEITDALGKTVYRSLSESNTMNVDLHDINEGVYFVKIKNKTGILKADKIVVNK